MQEVGGSIPPSSTKTVGFWCKEPKLVIVESYMYQIGRIAVVVGILLIAAGLLIGFSAMWLDVDGQAVNWLGVVPVGFVVLLVGTVMTQLSGTNKQNKHIDLE